MLVLAVVLWEPVSGLVRDGWLSGTFPWTGEGTDDAAGGGAGDAGSDGRADDAGAGGEADGGGSGGGADAGEAGGGDSGESEALCGWRLAELAGETVLSVDGVVLYEAKVIRVKDGDTFVAELGGTETTVRLIGIDCPESVHPDEELNSPEGEAAAACAEGILQAGRPVFLEYDEERLDVYGRDLAYVWLDRAVDTGSYEDFCGSNVGALLVRAGHAAAVYYKPNGKYREWYERLEAEAGMAG